MQIIDRQYIYRQGECSFQNFVSLDTDHLTSVLSWRNNDEIRKWMYNPEKITLENHLSFVRTLADREDVYYWLVYKGDLPVAVTSITGVSYMDKKAEIGYYLCPDQNIPALGIIYDICDFYLHTIGIKQLHGCTMIENHGAMLMDIFLGFRYVSSCQKYCGKETHMFWNLEMTWESFERDHVGKKDLRCYMNFIKKYYKGGTLSLELTKY